MYFLCWWKPALDPLIKEEEFSWYPSKRHKGFGLIFGCLFRRKKQSQASCQQSRAKVNFLASLAKVTWEDLALPCPTFSYVSSFYQLNKGHSGHLPVLAYATKMWCYLFCASKEFRMWSKLGRKRRRKLISTEGLWLFYSLLWTLETAL